LRGKTLTCPNAACGKAFILPAPTATTEAVAPAPDAQTRTHPQPSSAEQSPPPRSSSPRRKPAEAAEEKDGVSMRTVLGWSVLGLVMLSGLGGIGWLVYSIKEMRNRPASGLVAGAKPDEKQKDSQPQGTTQGASKSPANQKEEKKAQTKSEDIARPAPKPESKQVPVAEKAPSAEAPPENLEWPPVGPTRSAPGDRVVQEFKTARAACVEARKKARADLLAQYPKKREEIQKSNLPPNEKAKVLQDLQTDQFALAYGPGQNSGKGPLPTNPAMQEAVADYWRTLETATRKLGEVAEKGLAAYEQAGVTDPQKLRPLLAARLAAQHTDLLGVWASEGKTGYDVWVIDVAETTGGWQVEGSVNYSKGTTGYIHHGEDITFKDGTLSFLAGPVDTRTKKVGAGIPVTLKLQEGKLLFASRGPRPVAKVMRRTGEEAARASIEYWGVRKAPPAGSEPAADKPDPTDANYVWRQLAMLSSFAWYDGKGRGPRAGEILSIPHRSSKPTLTPGPYGTIADMLLKRAPGAGVNDALAKDLLRRYDDLAESPYPYLRRATEQGHAICRARIQLGLGDEMFGNTPASSIREFQQKVFLPAGEYVFQREADRLELEDALRKQYPDKRFIVVDAPLSPESRAKLRELMTNAGNMMQDVKQRAVVSGLLRYADMNQVDRNAAFWQKWLLPLARRCGGPVSEKPLVQVEGAWKPRMFKQDRFMRLDDFRLRNVAGQDLTHAVVELIAENQWGEKAAHYYYLDRLEVAEVAKLVVHPRWDKRRLDFTNTIKVTWSIWADQGTNVGRQLKLTSPTPNPDPAGWRKDYLAYDAQYAAQGEALGALVRTLGLLPSSPKGQRLWLLAAVAPRTSYALRLPGEGKSGRTLVLRFLRLDADGTAIEAEVFDLGSGKPFRADMPVWKGRLTEDQREGVAVRLDAGWTFLIGPDDRPRISLSPKEGASPAKEVPLFGVNLP
jgi:hypothetical protein